MYKFIQRLNFRKPESLRYWVVETGKIFPIGFLEEDRGGVAIYFFRKKWAVQSTAVFQSYLNNRK